MSVVHQMIGGAIGFAFAGPLGAIAGIVIGANLSRNRAAGGAAASDSASAQSSYFLSLFSMFGKMAKADGQVTGDEIDFVDRFAKERMGLDPAARKFSAKIFNAAKDSPYTFLDFANQFYSIFKRRPEMLRTMLELLTGLAMADGQISAEERGHLAEACRAFHIRSEEFDRIMHQNDADFDHYYAILGCDPSDSLEVIKKKYRKLAIDYHPDKIISKGLPDDFIKFAEEKFRSINEAYEKIRQKRDIKND